MNIRPSHSRPPFRNFGILGALVLTAALAFAGEPEDNIAPWQCDLAYFPSYNKLLVKATSYYRKPGAVVTLRDAKQTIVWRKELPLQDGRIEAILDVPPLEGDYTVHIDSADGEHRWTHEITRRKYPWEGNQLGITEKVLPPFTPMTVADRTVGVVLRDYTLDGLGLFTQVTSEQQPLLAAPVRLLADGQPLADPCGAFANKTEGRVVYHGEARHGEVLIRNATTIEYDGCARFELTLAPRRETATIESLVLEIPIEDQASTLWHVCREALRVNLAGEIPKGIGLFWTNRDFNWKNYYGGETAFRGYFLPYIWIGNEDRGLAWFADNDKNWGTDPKAEKPYLTLHREGGVLTLRVHLVQAPTVLDQPRTLVFGLMASPAKPMPENWREWISGRADFSWVGSQYYGTRAATNGKYPEGYDFGLVELLRLVRRAHLFKEPMPDTGASIAAWVERAVPKEFHPDAKQRLLNLANAFINHGRDRSAYVSSYFEEHNTLISHEECQTFGWEWTGEFYPWWSGYLSQFAGKLPQDPKQYDLGMPYSAAPSYHDFAVWYAAEFIKHGAGTYLDNVMPFSIRNTVVTDAYRVSPDFIQPSAAIWAQREYHKRLWVLHQTATPADTPGIMMIHMTNTKLLPLLSFNQIDLDLEWRDEAQPFQAKYAPDLLRAETLGKHTGNIPTALANTHGSEKDANLHAMCSRTRDAGLLVHEARHPQPWNRYDPFERTLRDFGYDQADARVYNYWAKEAPVTVSDERVKWLLCRRNGRLLLLLCSWIPERRGEPYAPTPDADEAAKALAQAGKTRYDTITVHLDLAQLECRPAAVKDAEYPDGKTVWTPPDLHPHHVPGWMRSHYPPGKFEFTYPGDVAWDKDRGTLTVPLRGYGARMLILEQTGDELP